MRSENISHGQEERSFIERARRGQIVQCAIDAIAELGYANASLAEIARRAGVSKGVISYHFEGRRELVEEVVKSVLAKATEVMRPRIIAERSVAGASGLPDDQSRVSRFSSQPHTRAAEHRGWRPH
jgi:TetR/AcrR family fatty acid metabolism transcriptional regulator